MHVQSPRIKHIRNSCHLTGYIILANIKMKVLLEDAESLLQLHFPGNPSGKQLLSLPLIPGPGFEVPSFPVLGYAQTLPLFKGRASTILF